MGCKKRAINAIKLSKIQSHTQIQSILLKFGDLLRKLPELSTVNIDAAANPRDVHISRQTRVSFLRLVVILLLSGFFTLHSVRAAPEN